MTSYTRGRFEFIGPDSWSEEQTKKMGDAILKKAANQIQADNKKLEKLKNKKARK